MVKKIIEMLERHPLLIMVFIFLLPLCISLVMYIPWLSFSKGSVDGWLSFWGSYLGGTIGTLGVIMTTYYLIKNESSLTEKKMFMEDERKRDLLFLELQLKKNEELIDSLIELNYKWVTLTNTLMEFSACKEKYLRGMENNQVVLEKLKDYYMNRKIFSDQQSRVVLHLKTFHTDAELRDFLNRVDGVITKYNILSDKICKCTDLTECMNYLDEIFSFQNEFEAYDEIFTFYSQKYKSLVKSLNQKN